MSESRRRREPGTLPRPLAFLAALGLIGGTGFWVSVLPPGAVPGPVPPPPTASARPTPALAGRPSPAVEDAVRQGPAGFVAFADGVSGLRSRTRWYTIGHVIAGGDGCTGTWTGGLSASERPAKRPAGPSAGERPGGLSAGGRPAGLSAERLRRLRAGGAEAGPVFGGPRGRELAAACARPDRLVPAYRRVIGGLGASYAEFEVRDSADRAAVTRRAHAIRALQRERRLRVSFSLPLEPYGLAARDAAMLRLTRQAGADVGTVNLLAAMEPSGPFGGGTHRIALALRAARTQVAEAQAVPDTGEAWRRVAVTCVLTSPADLSEAEATTLAAFAGRHELAWLSLRGTPPQAPVARALRRTRG
ncbi:hypothetical protein [Nonomuraea rhizosphaerae]|uniref:hypothetical protein n=1 Tax=Nonomuraea rhizosphaerae TaxID=2665663 RepID=UPI001C5ED832|nr:hypothetical protein [Nonomuraea rhizosphaerae]